MPAPSGVNSIFISNAGGFATRAEPPVEPASGGCNWPIVRGEYAGQMRGAKPGIGETGPAGAAAAGIGCAAPEPGAAAEAAGVVGATPGTGGATAIGAAGAGGALGEVVGAVLLVDLSTAYPTKAVRATRTMGRAIFAIFEPAGIRVVVKAIRAAKDDQGLTKCENASSFAQPLYTNGGVFEMVVAG